MAKDKGRPPLTPRIDAQDARIAALEALLPDVLERLSNIASQLNKEARPTVDGYTASQYQARFNRWTPSGS
jgi:uncharacterized membrane protein (UPF0182 family)